MRHRRDRTRRSVRPGSIVAAGLMGTALVGTTTTVLAMGKGGGTPSRLTISGPPSEELAAEGKKEVEGPPDGVLISREEYEALLKSAKAAGVSKKTIDNRLIERSKNPQVGQSNKEPASGRERALDTESVSKSTGGKGSGGDDPLMIVPKEGRVEGSAPSPEAGEGSVQGKSPDVRLTTSDGEEKDKGAVKDSDKDVTTGDAVDALIDAATDLFQFDLFASWADEVDMNRDAEVTAAKVGTDKVEVSTTAKVNPTTSVVTNITTPLAVENQAKSTIEVTAVDIPTGRTKAKATKVVSDRADITGAAIGAVVTTIIESEGAGGVPPEAAVFNEGADTRSSPTPAIPEVSGTEEPPDPTVVADGGVGPIRTEEPETAPVRPEDDVQEPTSVGRSAPPAIKE